MRPDSRVAVALSGGVDSIVLLHLLAGLRGESGLAVHAIHVNHGLSPNADAWEKFCSNACAALDIGFAALRLKLAHVPGESLEALARQARYAALETAAAELRVDTIVLAHHADDQAETVLLQLLRGAASKGLAAMAAWRYTGDGIRYWRPLLQTTRKDIVEYARRRNLQWIEDESNQSIQYKRNFLRTQILPRLEEGFPGYRTSLARTAAHAAEAAQLLDQLADLDLAAAVDGDRLSVKILRELGPLRAQNLLRRILGRRGFAVPPGERLAEFVRQAFDAGRDRHPALELGHHDVLRSDGGTIAVLRNAPALPFVAAWRKESEVVLPHGTLRFTPAQGAGIQAAKIPDSGLTIRTRQGGERFRVAANRPTRTLKNLMQEAGVAAALRSRWPLVVHDDELVAVPGIGVSVDWQCPPLEMGWRIEWHPAMQKPA